MAQVIVGPPFRLAEVHREDRLRTLERLDLGFLIDRKHHRIVRRVHVQTDDIPYFVDELRIGRILNHCVTCGCSPNVRQMRPIIV